VSLERLLVSELSSPGHFEPFLGAGVGFNFWHELFIYFYTLLAFRTGGNLWSLVGNQLSCWTIETGGKGNERKFILQHVFSRPAHLTLLRFKIITVKYFPIV